MVYFKTSQEWLEQSSLLLQARPDSARVTTKYTPNPPLKKRRLNKPSRKRDKTKDDTAQADSQAESSDAAASAPATLTMKTYDPVSGVCLKYRTEKQQEVGRLIGVGGLSAIARVMAGMENGAVPANAADVEGGQDKQQDIGDAVAEKNEEAVEEGDAKAEGKSETRPKRKSVSFAAGVEVHKIPPQQQSGGGAGGGGGGGGKKKKKGKGR